MQENTGIIIGQLTIAYDRGVKRNRAVDLGLDSEPEETPDGGLVRGLGSHWRSEEDRDLVRQRGTEEQRIRKEFARSFMAAPLPGTYVLPSRGDGQRFLDQLDPAPRADMRVTVAEYTLGVLTQAPEDVRLWSDRVKRQLANVPLGRSKEVGIEAIAVLQNLAACPMLGSGTRETILALIEDAKLSTVDRVDFKRRLAALDVEVSAAPIEPRRVRRPGMERAS